MTKEQALTVHTYVCISLKQVSRCNSVIDAFTKPLDRLRSEVFVIRPEDCIHHTTLVFASNEEFIRFHAIDPAFQYRADFIRALLKIFDENRSVREMRIDLNTGRELVVLLSRKKDEINIEFRMEQKKRLTLLAHDFHNIL